MTPEKRIRRLLASIYGDDQAETTWPQLETKLDSFRRQHPSLAQQATPLNQRDAVLITYGDQFQQEGQAPLQTLAEFLTRHIGDTISTVHILPFFPYTSDDGFSVVDYQVVDPKLGDWADITRLGESYRLMVDAVINHVSRASPWFQAFRRGEKPYTDYFIAVDPATDLSQVVRPRTLPLLTPVETAHGIRHVWTTFSADQIDLNFAAPGVLLAIIDVLLDYVARGAEIIRLDAIAYLWKEIGGECIHQPQTHAIVKLWRAVLDEVAPGVILITETNVPHAENISYFGEPLPAGGTDEAQMVYNFSLAPLILHAFQTGEAQRLADWAAALQAPAAGATYFNFIASHDGIGVRPAEGILTALEIQALADRTLAHGGQVSYKTDRDGSKSIYELNITLYDFLNHPNHPQTWDVARFLASQAILLTLAGVPGIYVHSLFGTRNCDRCLAETGRARSLNREKFNLAELEDLLAQPAAHARPVLDGYLHLLRVRCQHPAFHPAAAQRILCLNPAVFAAVRSGGWGDEHDFVVALVNVSAQPQQVQLNLREHNLPQTQRWHEQLQAQSCQADGTVLAYELVPYAAAWLVPGA